MMKRFLKSHTALLSVLFAMAAFSYAIATTADSRSKTLTPPDNTPPPALKPITFANPIYPASADRDLGDVVPGKFFHRYIRCKGGLPPYKCLAGSLNNALFLGFNGFFDTTVTTKIRPPLPPAFPVGPYRFLTTAKSKGTTDTHTEPFRLSVVTDTRFRFAIGPNLNDATQFRKYVDQISIINPTLPLTFALVGTVSLNGVAQPSLASLGLSLTKREGVIYGQPLAAGVITFTVSCTDASGNVALSRDGTAPNQTFSITVDPNKVAASDTLCMGIKVKAGKNGTGSSIQYSGLININGTLSALLGKPVTFRIGNFVSPTAYFDDKGSATNATGTSADKTNTIVKAKISAAGVLTISVTNATLATTDVLELPVRTGATRSFGDAVLADGLGGRSATVGGDVGDTSIEQSVSVTKSSTDSLSLDGSTSAAGAFLVLSTVSGHDDKTGAGDKWRVTFVANPPSGTSFTTATSLQLSVGNLGNTLTAVPKPSSVSATFKADSTTRNAVTHFSLSTKSLKGSYTTTYMDATATGIPVSGAAFTGEDPSYSTQIVLSDSTGTALFSGAAGVTIFPKKNGWTSTAPK